MESAGASEARPRFGSARNLACQAPGAKAPSPLRSAGPLQMVVPAICSLMGSSQQAPDRA